jgi:alkylhydroperoxidase family enzyme
VPPSAALGKALRATRRPQRHPFATLTSMSWLPGHTSDSLEMVLSLRPEAAARAHELEAALYAGDRLDSTIVALVRDRVNHLLGVGGATSEWRATATTTDRERAALAFAEQYVLDPSGITDRDAVALNTLFTEPELTTLTFAVAVYDAMGRVRLVLDIEPEAVSA